MENITILTDDKLVGLYIKGNNDAFDILVERHKSRLFTSINNIVKNSYLVNDIFKATFVTAIITITQGR